MLYDMLRILSLKYTVNKSIINTCVRKSYVESVS